MDDCEQEKMLSVDVVMERRFEEVLRLPLIQKCILKLFNAPIAEKCLNKQEHCIATINSRNG